jgi:hypothetical protein
MNKDRRTKIERIIRLVEDFEEELQQIAFDEKEAYDNLTDNLRQTERGQQAEAAFEALDSAVGGMEELLSGLRTAVE